MTLISDDYRRLNSELHELNEEYGAFAAKRAPTIANIVKQLGFKSVLDYGCGKGNFKVALSALCPGVEIREYDPAFPDKAADPEPADFVTLLDVAEHIETEYVDDVLDHIQRLARKGAFMIISTIPADKNLPDGRNAHITIKPSSWWLEKLKARFVIHQAFDKPGAGLTVILATKP